MPDTLISAIICTHNRDNYLGAAIDSLLTQDFASGFEVIVVDNGSSDRTRSVVEQRANHPHLKYVYEPVIGLSVARNTGAQVASSEILAYLDDDAVASRGWLQVLYNAYKNNPKLAIAGGKVSLLWPEGMQSPLWLSPGLAANLGAYDLGENIVSIDKPGLTPRGLNYSIRRAFLEEIGGFDPQLGRIGKKLLSNEELQITELALQAGWQVMYLPEAHVFHNVSPERIKRSWFLNRGWWQGISECYREQLAGTAGFSQLKRGSERFLRGLYKAVKYFADPAERFDKLVYAYGQIGYLNAAIAGLLAKRVNSQ
ncbi:glycosyltransferase family 2 protein [Fischerella thermalis]|jgi:glycosyltransferase involved in cell wall biosynthesis|uniref:Glycosyl transferase family 2 n=2 Tax=Fischerella TaxID=1190 RepID=G6FTE0_9CYAN|nr:glycosyltransferase family 2 protein [Fischerella thermalis]PLZ84978.1 glycosyltransferase [Fischerella thermalis CCMEE 5196]EHC13873.1 glycosyl transferase family 2 [Fischerella thermalis JSC-11]MBF1990062.1 glycosyltransferase family 2 protein [Fischerella thermalis M58_A2018_009]MBF2059895.1 glycosyltransferase family 2 protein [Fischerella thermalis M66_A2018_004]MBF2071886.1 glycosyltransferase family 2 protein [Fischerella thermalis M48_A2018_028]